MGYCGVVEVQSLEDALGATCGRPSKARCTDCGVAICAAHTERCAVCREIFCSSCMTFHPAQHGKPAAPVAVGRVTQRTA